MDHLELLRPDHLDQETWEAIESYRRRLVTAVRIGDDPAVLGGGKELIECIARAVLDARGVTLGANADFPKLLNEALRALARQPGRDLSASPELRVIASSALTIATKVNEIRNQGGTGHGRSRLPEIRDEVVHVVADAAMLWSRWALRRLGHVLARDVENLIASLRSAIRREDLQRQFTAVLMPEQPPEDQHRLGVVFGQRAAGGFGNAWAVGLSGPAETADLELWPPDFRLGLVEGLMIDERGNISLRDYVVAPLIDILRPIPNAAARQGLAELAGLVPDAPWVVPSGFNIPVPPSVILDDLRARSAEVDASVQPSFEELISALERAIPTEPG